MKIKYLKYLFLPIMVLVIGITASCERDDICPESTPTTPSLIITAFDVDEQDNKKNIFGLRIQGVGIDKVLTGYNVVTNDSIVLPLKTHINTSQYKIHSNYTYDDNDTPDDTSDDIIGGNQDIVTISYTTENVFVSRACGYKTIFKAVEIVVENDGDNWIQSIQPLNNPQSVENETAVHFNLFH
ncbi:DUF6452 family protein [Gelatiniphilus marinus]|uniref:DUF6452 family protein n=1 Tax=Gelatiniphilus marinus TaxID=1759464 RepID=A0ABW5JUD5_9FLAO